MDLGIYHHFGSPYDRNFNKRSIAHNTLLAYDPKEDWGWLSNDGGLEYAVAHYPTEWMEW